MTNEWRLLWSAKIMQVKNNTDMNKSLALSNTKKETDLGTLVVPFDQTFHLLHLLGVR